MDNTTRQNLRNFLSAAKTIQELVNPDSWSRASNPRESPIQLPPITIPTLRLPFPDGTSALIRSKNLPEDVAEKLLQRLSFWVAQMQQLHITNFQRTCDNLAHYTACHDFFPVLATRYERSYEDDYMANLRSTLERRLSCVPDKYDCEGKKCLFNVKYTPVLERYFMINAYPSAMERCLLAKRSGMTARQIEVWFQNHRNRSKKYGNLLHRCESAHQRISLDALEKEVIRTTTPELTEYCSGDEDEGSLSDEGSQVDAVAHPFASWSPPHAFPARYTPSSSFDPFPRIDGRFAFAAPQWLRRPATIPIEKRPADMDELATLFASKLSFSESITSRPPKTKASRSPTGKAWYCATVTIPLRAPLPSFVKPSSTFHASSPSPQQHRRFSPFPTRLVSGSSPSSKPRLPRRLPSWSMPSVSPSKTTNPPSRTASLESISSCDSSSSGSSLEDLVTPPMTPGPLQGAELIFNDIFDNSLAFDFPNFSLPSTPFSFDASQAKMHGAFPSILSPFQYVTSS